MAGGGALARHEQRQALTSSRRSAAGSASEPRLGEQAMARRAVASFAHAFYFLHSILGELLGVPVGNADYMAGGYETLTTSTAAPRQQQTRAP